MFKEVVKNYIHHITLSHSQSEECCTGLEGINLAIINSNISVTFSERPIPIETARAQA